MTSIKNIKGILAPMVTPLKGSDELDHKGIDDLIEHILAGGVSGLFVLGTTGEALSLSCRLRQEVIEKVCSRVAGRVPVIVGVTDTSLIESLNLARKAAAAGADAVAAAPPFYYTATQRELIDYYLFLAESTPLPVYLYNMPMHTKTSLEPETVKEIARHENVAGLKDSSGDAIYFKMLQRIMADRPDFPLYMGPEEIMAEAVLMGAAGGVNGGANLFPALYTQLYKAAVEKDVDRLKKLQEKVMQISASVYAHGYLPAMKFALSHMGLCGEQMAMPFHGLSNEKKELIKHFLDHFNWEA